MSDIVTYDASLVYSAALHCVYYFAGVSFSRPNVFEPLHSTQFVQINGEINTANPFECSCSLSQL